MYYYTDVLDAYSTLYCISENETVLVNLTSPYNIFRVLKMIQNYP